MVQEKKQEVMLIVHGLENVFSYRTYWEKVTHFCTSAPAYWTTNLYFCNKCKKSLPISIAMNLVLDVGKRFLIFLF